MQSVVYHPNKIDLIAKFFLVLGVFFIPISTAAMEIGLVTAALLVVLSGNWSEKIAFIKSRPALWTSLILFSLILINITHGVVAWHDRLIMAKKYLPLLAIPLLAWLFTQESTRKKALFSFLLSIFIVWVLSYFLFYFNLSIVKPGATALFHDHISVGILSAFSIFVFLSFFYSTARHQKYFYLLGFFIGTWYLFVINSGRSAYFIFFALLIFFFWKKWRWKGMMYAFVIACILFLLSFLYSPIFHSVTVTALQDGHQYLTGEKHQYGSASLRMVSIKAAMALLKEHPFIGVGTGSFYQAAAGLPWMTPQINTEPVSNDWFNISVQVGVLGFLLILLMYSIQCKESTTLPAPYAQIAQLLLCTMILSGVIGSPLVDSIEAHFYSVFVALCFASNYFIKQT